MAKRFIFNQPAKSISAILPSSEPRKFAEPTKDQVQKAKETWKRLAPKEAKGLIK